MIHSPEPTISTILEKLSHRPYLTKTDGIGGQYKAEPEDFRVREVPLYPCSGEGQHLYVEVEKRDLTTDEAIRTIASHYGFDPRDVGVAGMKDKRAITTQWMSLPAHLMYSVDIAGDEVAEGLRILQAELHGNKLRTGHLEGNHFELVLRDFEGEAEEALRQTESALEVLRRIGAPNYFGMQRFGHGGSTVELGIGLLAEDPSAFRSVRKKRRLKKLAYNAVQSAIFNGVLAQRIESQTVDTVMLGDRIEWHSERRYLRADNEAEREEAQSAVDSGDASVSGPMPGPRHPEADGKPRELELEEYEYWGLTDESFAAAGKLALGTRRPFTVPVKNASAERTSDGGVRLAFFLPSGSYATVVLREIMKHQN